MSPCRLVVASVFFGLCACQPQPERGKGSSDEQEWRPVVTGKQAEPPVRHPAPPVEPARKEYGNIADLEKALKGKTHAEVVTLLGKPQQGKAREARLKNGKTRSYDLLWLYPNSNPRWRVADPVSGLGPERLVVRFGFPTGYDQQEDFPPARVNMVSDNMVWWDTE